MIKILYLHGFGSHYDSEHEKIVQLSEIGKIYGINLDYCRGYDYICGQVYDEIIQNQIDVLVGTSLGGYLAAMMGDYIGIPFVAINPMTSPSETLTKWLGAFYSSDGKDQTLSESIVGGYPDIVEKGRGLVLLDSADEIVAANSTKELLDDVFECHLFSGGRHAFTHMQESLPIIQTFVEKLI